MLTPKQEKFCMTYIETGNATEAYRRAYEVKKMLPITINKRACELLQNRKITGRVIELRAPAVEKAQLTLENHLSDLAALKALAINEKQYSAAIRAEELRAKAAGLYKNLDEVSVAVETHEERMRRLRGESCD